MQGVSPVLGRQLRDLLIHRHIPKGLSIISGALEEVVSPSTPDIDAIELTAELANWIDFDFSIRDGVASALKRWPKGMRGELSHRGALLLRFTDATIFMHNEEFEEAAIGFHEVINNKEILCDPHLQLIANCYCARCRYCQSRYVEADCLALEAGKQSQLKDGVFQLAVVDILRSRIVLKAKPAKEAIPIATKLLENTRKVFEATEDHITKGNILIFLAQVAKMAPHKGKQPIVLLKEAISEFEEHKKILESEKDPLKTGHPGEARARVLLARLLRDRANALKAEVEREPAPARVERHDLLLLSILQPLERAQSVLQRSCPQLSADLEKVSLEIHHDLDESDESVEKRPPRAAAAAEIGKLRDSSLQQLGLATDIYKGLKHWRGFSNARTISAKVLLDSDDYDGATRAGEEAYRLGKEKGDDTLQANAAIALSKITYTMLEEGIDGADHATNAHYWAETALKHAQHAAPRILGRAYVWQALTAPDRQQAEFHRDAARDILKEFPGGSLQRDFDILQRHLNAGGEAVTDLIGWARTPRGKTFEQLECAITRIGWLAAGGDLAAFIALFGGLGHMSYNHAYGLLGRAGIYKMPNARMKEHG